VRNLVLSPEKGSAWLQSPGATERIAPSLPCTLSSGASGRPDTIAVCQQRMGRTIGFEEGFLLMKRDISSYEKVNDRVAHSAEFVHRRHRNSRYPTPRLRLYSSNTILTTIIQMPPRIVPLEIWWLVIENLRGDFNTLYACTQVCRSWRKGSKRLLNDFFVEFSNRQDIALAGKRRGSSWKGPRHVTVVGDTRHVSIPHLGTFATMLTRKWTRVGKLTIKSADWITGDIHADVFLHLAAWPSITGCHSVGFTVTVNSRAEFKWNPLGRYEAA